VLQYVQSIHQIVGDVSDALVSYEKDRRYVVDLRTNSTAAVSALRIAKIRFIDGRASFLDVLVSDSRSYKAQISKAQAELSERLALVQLYHATGGGWQAEPPAHQ
jgi:multidrug efflux system outer membrane protein